MNLATIVLAAAVMAREATPIAGDVVDARSRPIAEAEVVLTAGPAPMARYRSSPDEDRRGRAVPTRWPRSRRSRRGFLSPGAIWAYRPGKGLGVVDLIRADKPDQAHRLVLEPQAIRRMTIRDADTKPIAGRG